MLYEVITPLADGTLVHVPEGLDEAVALLAGDVLSTADVRPSPATPGRLPPSEASPSRCTTVWPNRSTSPGRTSAAASVITSYSIHYTKLYDETSRRGPTWTNPGRLLPDSCR